MTTNRAVIDTSDQNTGPSVEESFAALKEEGLITDEENSTTDGDTSSTVDGESQGGDGVEAEGQGDRPSWLPKKFKSPEDMAKAYAELEKKQSKSEPDATDEGKTKTETTEGEQEAREAVKNAGLDFDALSDEYTEKGALSEASIKKLEEGGIPRAFIDNYLAGIEAQTALYEIQVQGIVGGADGYEALLTWGGDNLTDAEIDAFDAAVNSGDLTQAQIAVKGLQARMQLAQGVSPERQVDGKGGSSSDVYESQAQVEADMNDPRYATDEAFRQKVYAKLDRSNL